MRLIRLCQAVRCSQPQISVFLGASGHGCVDVWSSEMGDHRGGAEDRRGVGVADGARTEVARLETRTRVSKRKKAEEDEPMTTEEGDWEDDPNDDPNLESGDADPRDSAGRS
ncbi:hypothetical protein B0H14DRAFT_2571780 [Mycena olivaceomarginata]|nr:hypothetical protein B0H14DRAFT_2571780 [Mycena olivaceomarginata]